MFQKNRLLLFISALIILKKNQGHGLGSEKPLPKPGKQGTLSEVNGDAREWNYKRLHESLRKPASQSVSTASTVDKEDNCEGMKKLRDLKHGLRRHPTKTHVFQAGLPSTRCNNEECNITIAENVGSMRREKSPSKNQLEVEKINDNERNDGSHKVSRGRSDRDKKREISVCPVAVSPDHNIHVSVLGLF